MNSKIRENKLFIFVLLSVFFIYIIYINRSAANIIFQDQYDFLGFIERYFNGNLKFIDLWQSHMEHRTLGYNILFVINAKYFDLNTLYEMYLGSIFLVITSVLLFRQYKKSLNFDTSKLWTTFAFIPIVLIVFSLNQWENIVFGLGMSIFLRMMFFLLTFITFDNMLSGKSSTPFVILLTLSILLFGAGYSPAIVVSMVLILVLKIYIDRKTSKERNIKSLLTIIIASSILFLIYFYKIYDKNMVNNTTGITEKVEFILNNPIMAIKFLLSSFSSSLIGLNFLNKYFDDVGILILGVFVIIIYLSSLILFIKVKMYEKTYLPLLLIIYSLIIYGLILIGRLDYGVKYGMSSRYVTDTQYGIVGATWIFIFYLFNKIKRKIVDFKSYIFILICIFLVSASQLIIFFTEWNIGPYRQENFNQLRDIAIYPELYHDSDFENFQYPIDKVKDGLEILKKNNLNVFSEDPKFLIGSNLESAKVGYGWYSKDSNGQSWINKSSIARFKSGSNGNMSIKGYVPDVYQKEVNIKIYINEHLIETKTLEHGNFTLDFPIAKNSNIDLKIQVDQSFVPKELGINEDSRELSILIQAIEVE